MSQCSERYKAVIEALQRFQTVIGVPIKNRSYGVMDPKILLKGTLGQFRIHKHPGAKDKNHFVLLFETKDDVFSITGYKPVELLLFNIQIKSNDQNPTSTKNQTVLRIKPRP
jgi:hypothetical protein